MIGFDSETGEEIMVQDPYLKRRSMWTVAFGTVDGDIYMCNNPGELIWWRKADQSALKLWFCEERFELNEH